MAWTRACATADIAAGEAIQLDLDPPIAIFNVDGDFFATEDTCPHGQASLAEGYIEGSEVECSWHFAKFCIKTGALLGPPASSPIRTYPVQVRGDDVLVDVPD